MPQIMIDTASESAATLRETAAMLNFIADRMAASVPEGTLTPVPAVDSTVRIPTAIIPPPPAPVIPAPPAPVIPPPPQPTDATLLQPAALAADIARTDVVPLDKAGFPWDARIHSETPTINKSDGLWRMKRGIGDKRELVEAVEAELRANYPAPVNAAPIIPPPPVSLPAAAPVIPPPPAVVAAPNAPAATVMVPPPPPVAGSVPSGTDEGAAFRTLMNKVAGHTGPEGRLRREIMVPIYESLGCKSLTDFHKARDKIPALLEAIEALLA